MSFEPKPAAFSFTYPAILTEPEAAEFLRIGLTKLRELRRSELIPYIPGKPVRYLSLSLLDWIKEQEVQVTAEAPRPATKRSTSYKTNPDKAALRAGILG
ncbi:helix-turn-helix domain-containing protein [Sulfitobacter sp.]|uniref:helix-turn-helix domain-containing protein n=1 Tax=Sulfitobacter sp. TaxID=1903071 RepID=UPI00272AAA37|nr:helix-turn-helix domain-containing protein [Sulfitobacter sp.]